MWARAVLASTLLVFAAATAHATPYTWKLSGEITYVDPVLAGAFTAGEDASITLTIDPDTAGAEWSPDIYQYLGAVLTASLEFGTYSATGTLGVLRIADNWTLGDVWLALFDSSQDPNTTLSGGSFAGFDLAYFSAALGDFSATVFDGYAIPTVPLDPLDFPDERTISLNFFDPAYPGNPFYAHSVNASIDTLTVVPEPGAGALLVAGLVALGAAQRRRSAFPRR